MGIGRSGARIGALAVAVAVACPLPAAAAEPPSVWERAVEATLQCVPFAREVSGVLIWGDAHTWWRQAEGRYERGREPRPGAVMAFRPHGGMTLGHVAVVRRVVSAREVRLDHANWSLLDGRRGQIERDVSAVDVSEAGDWSRVRVWFGPIAALGGTSWPVEGFIYPRDRGARARIAASERAERKARERHARFAPPPAAAPHAVTVVAAVARMDSVLPVRSKPRRSGSLERLIAWRAGSAVASRGTDLGGNDARAGGSRATTEPRRRGRTSDRVVPVLAAASPVAPAPAKARTSRSAPLRSVADHSASESMPNDLLQLTRPARPATPARR